MEDRNTVMGELCQMTHIVLASSLIPVMATAN